MDHITITECTTFLVLQINTILTKKSPGFDMVWKSGHPVSVLMIIQLHTRPWTR